MSEFKRILVGLELDAETQAVTAGSLKASQQAVWLAKATGGRILYLHSTYDEARYPERDSSAPIAPAELSDLGRAKLAEVVADTRSAGVESELRIVEEQAWLALVYVALRGEADLVVLGKRNRAPTDGRRLGYVAVKLLRKCPTAVWVVEPDHDLVHRLVLAASDLSAVGDRAVCIAAEIANLQGCDLHLVHAYQVPMSLQLEAARLSDVEYGARMDTLKKSATSHLQGCLGGLREGKELEVKIHIGKGAASTVIREAVAHLDPDLLVMGTVSRGGLAGILIGSTAERLLDRVDCSILAVKPLDFICPVELPK